MTLKIFVTLNPTSGTIYGELLSNNYSSTYILQLLLYVVVIIAGVQNVSAIPALDSKSQCNALFQTNRNLKIPSHYIGKVKRHSKSEFSDYSICKTLVN